MSTVPEKGSSDSDSKLRSLYDRLLKAGLRSREAVKVANSIKDKIGKDDYTNTELEIIKEINKLDQEEREQGTIETIKEEEKKLSKQTWGAKERLAFKFKDTDRFNSLLKAISERSNAEVLKTDFSDHSDNIFVEVELRPPNQALY